MGTGQTLFVILALVLFATVTVSINRVRMNANLQTITHYQDLESINHGQSLVERLSKIASEESGYQNLQSTNITPTITNSGRKLYTSIVIDNTRSLHNVDYKKVTVSVDDDSTMNASNLKSKHIVGFVDWWN